MGQFHSNQESSDQEGRNYGESILGSIPPFLFRRVRIARARRSRKSRERNWLHDHTRVPRRPPPGIRGGSFDFRGSDPVEGDERGPETKALIRQRILPSGRC